MEGINITMPEVAATASRLRSSNQSLDATLRQIRQLMNDLQSTWQSDAGNTMRDRFNALAPRFEQYRDVVENYSKFLDNTVSNYDATETSINSSASQFR